MAMFHTICSVFCNDWSIATNKICLLNSIYEIRARYDSQASEHQVKMIHTIPDDEDHKKRIPTPSPFIVTVMLCCLAHLFLCISTRRTVAIRCCIPFLSLSGYLLLNAILNSGEPQLNGLKHADKI